MTAWALAVDFGTTNTGAAVCELDKPDRVAEVKLSTASTVMPSAVLASGDELIAGEIAVNSWITAPAGSYEPNPKRRVVDGRISLGGQPRDVADLVAAVLRTVRKKAAHQFNNEPPAQVRLTHPAKWAGRRLDLLRDAARRAELPDVRLLPEPVAAAAYYAHRHADRGGDLIAVYDLGGGTLDVAVLKRRGGVAYEVLATGGVDPLGGETFDLVLQQHVIDMLAARGDTQLASLLTDQSLSLAEQRSFLDSVRNAKHTLSDLPNAAVSISGGAHSAVATVTRADFDRLIDPGLDLALEAVRNCLRNAHVSAQDLDRLYMVGGSSYVQRVSERLITELGITPATFDDPKLVTCLGALHHPIGDEPRAQAQPAPRPVPSLTAGRLQRCDLVIGISAVQSTFQRLHPGTQVAPYLEDHSITAIGPDDAHVSLVQVVGAGAEQDFAGAKTAADPTAWFAQRLAPDEVHVDNAQRCEAFGTTGWRIDGSISGRPSSFIAAREFLVRVIGAPPETTEAILQRTADQEPESANGARYTMTASLFLPTEYVVSQQVIALELRPVNDPETTLLRTVVQRLRELSTVAPQDAARSSAADWGFQTPPLAVPIFGGLAGWAVSASPTPGVAALVVHAHQEATTLARSFDQLQQRHVSALVMAPMPPGGVFRKPSSWDACSPYLPYLMLDPAEPTGAG